MALCCNSPLPLPFRSKSSSTLRCSSDLCYSTSSPVSSTSSSQPKSSKSVDYWEQLPEEIIDRIFSYLTDKDHNVVSAVCSRWSLSSKAHRRTFDISCFPLPFRQLLNNYHLHATISSLSILQYVNLEGSKTINDETMTILAAHAPNLRKLRIARSQVTNEGIKILTLACVHIRSLHIAKTSTISNEALRSISDNCKELEILELPECYNISDSGLELLSRSQAAPRLEEISLSCLDLITDKGLGFLAQGCQQLKKIDLVLCSRITDQGVVALSQGCKKLEEVNLYDCEEVGDTGVVALAQNCSALHTLMLSNTSITDISLNQLALHCNDLRVLHLSRCPITSQGVKSLAATCHMIQTLVANTCRNVNDEALEQLSKGCPELNVLHLSACPITDSGIELLAENCSNLTVLNLNSCNHITDEGVVSIGKGFPRLHTLTLNSIKNITDSSLEALTCSFLPELQKLHIMNCENLTQKGIETLRTKMPNLQLQSPYSTSPVVAALTATATPVTIQR